VVICLERGADLHMAQLMPLPLTFSCSSEIPIGFTFLVPAQPDSPGQRAVKLVCGQIGALRDTVCPSRSDAASSRSRRGGSGYPSCLCIRDGRNDGQAACSSPPAFVCELDTRVVQNDTPRRVYSRRTKLN